MSDNIVTIKDVKNNPKVIKLIEGANELLRAMGYTEHGLRHIKVVTSITKYVLENLGVGAREIELGQIAGYLHDIGNSVNRVHHPSTGGAIAYHILTEMGMPIEEIIPIIGAIGNHEQTVGEPVSTISAALILADKSDVHFSRVQNPVMETFDVHDRVNYAAQKSRLIMDNDAKTAELQIEIDSAYASVMEYFEIFMSRMIMCRKSANFIGYKFSLYINGTYLE